MGRVVAVIGIVAIVLILMIWAPWLTQRYAEERAIDQFNSVWEGVIDGCGFNCTGCGVTGSERSLLGYEVEIEFACGLIPEDTPEHHQVDQVFVSVFGIVTGFDTP